MSYSERLVTGALVALVCIPAASFADTRAGGEGTTANVTVDNAVDEATDIWDTLESEAFTLNSTSNIIVTACSDASNPGGGTANTYHFVISLDDTSPGLNTVSERTLDEFYDDPDENDPDEVAICSTRFFAGVAAGPHTIYWLGSKATAAMADVIILDSTMTIGAFNGSEL